MSMQRTRLFAARALAAQVLAAQLLAALTLCAAAPRAQSDDTRNRRPLALQNARVLTMTSAGTLSGATILIEDGKITAVGAPDQVELPPGCRRIDLSGRTVMPGLVHAWSSAGLGKPTPRLQQDGNSSRRRSSGGKGGNLAGRTLTGSLYPRQEIFEELLQAGVTTLVLKPSGDGIPGQAARLDPADPATPRDDKAFMVMQPSANTGSRKLFEGAFELGEKTLKEREEAKKKAEEAKKKAAEKPEGKDGGKGKPDQKKGEPKKDGEKKDEKPGDKPKPEPKPDPKPDPKPEPKPTPKPDEPKPKDDKKDGDKKGAKKDGGKKDAKKPEKKKDPNAEALADLLAGDQVAFINVSSGQEILHFERVLDDREFPRVLVVDSYRSSDGLVTDVLEQLETIAPAAILLPPSTTTFAYTDVRINPAADLVAEGYDVGFLLPDEPWEYALGSRESTSRFGTFASTGLWFELMQLARTGLAPEKVLAGITAVPARVLGLDESIGSIAKGRVADLLVWSGDPLDPRSSLLDVYHRGQLVERDSDKERSR